MDVASVLSDMNGAKNAYTRVEPAMDAVAPANFTPMNVDVVSATSVVLGVTDRVVSYRDRLAKLPEFDVSHVDNLIDYATAAWYVFITNLPSPKAGEFESLMQEATALRAKLLMWADPLVQNGNFEEEAVAKIKEGSGNKDTPSDLVALVGLYSGVWSEVENLCAVTQADLDRGAQIGPLLFAMVSLREQRKNPMSNASLRVRQAWTLLDTSYDQCRRGLSFLLWGTGDVDSIAPSLRRNAGRGTSTVAAVAPPSQPAPPVTGGGESIGGGDAPFLSFRRDE